MKNNTIETTNLIFKQSENNMFSVYRKVGNDIMFIKRSKYMASLIAAMRIAFGGKYRDEISTEI